MKKLIVLFCLMICPTLAEAVTRYLVPSGTGGCSNGSTNYNVATNSCGSGSSTVHTNANSAIGAMSGGDTLQVRAGTYTGPTSVVPSGTNLGAGATVITGYQTENPTFSYSSGSGGFLYCPSGTQSYIIIANLIWDGTTLNGGCDYIRYSNLEIKNSPDSGILVPGGVGHELLNSRIHNNGVHSISGVPQDHGIYFSGQNNIIDGNEFYNNWGCGVQVYSGSVNNSNTTVSNNRVHNNGVGVGCAGITANNGSGIKIFNNVVYSHNGGPGIQLWTGTSGSFIYGNTVYGNTSSGIEIVNGSDVTIKNNISSNNSSPFSQTGWSGFLTFDRNLCSSAGTICDDALTEPATTTFTDITNFVFTLKVGSKAINGGTPLGSPYNVDIVSTTRPQPPGGAWDVGAYESGGGVTPSCPGITPGLVASYAFEDSSNDSTGNNHTASLGSGWTYTAGKYGRGIVSTGASGITVADKDDLDMCGGFTYMGWINLPNTSGDYAFINKNPDSKSFLFAALTGHCGTGKPVGGWSQDPDYAVACYGTSLTTGSFQHMAITYDSTLPSANVKLYINGTMVTSTDGTTLLSPTTGTLQFCTSSFSETCPSGTIIDEIQIYNYPRTVAQIINDMNTAIQVGSPTELRISGGTRRIGPGVTLRYGLKK